jgi:hypothetical protein
MPARLSLARIHSELCRGETTSHIEPVSDIPDDFSISAWAPPKFFTDLSTFNITHFASGRDNLEVVVLGITPGVEDIVKADDGRDSCVLLETLDKYLCKCFSSFIPRIRLTTRDSHNVAPNSMQSRSTSAK